MTQPLRIVEQAGRVFATDNYVISGPGKVVALTKEDITKQLNRVLDLLYNRARMVEIKKRLNDGNIKVICLCGSTKFKEEFLKRQFEFTLAGHIVLTVGGFPHADMGESPESSLGEEVKIMLDDLHKRKIDLADIVYIINKDGYIGKSTQSEFDYAMSTHKIVSFMEEEHGKSLIEEYNSHGENLFVEGK